MAKLEDRGQRGLPPPPAPTRRGSNPWKLSDTARKREAQAARGQDTAAKLLEELLAGKEAEQAMSAPPPAAAAERAQPVQTRPRRAGFWPLLALLLIVGVIVKIAADVRAGADWRELIPALFVLFFIAHGWWRSRQRRGSRAEGKDED